MSKRSKSNKSNRSTKSNRSAKKFKPDASQLQAAESDAVNHKLLKPGSSDGRSFDKGDRSLTGSSSSKAKALDAGALEQRTREGRLVWNHSTHLQGLIPKLKKLCKQPGIYTITPAVLGRARSNSHKLMLKVSVPIRGGYKLIARNGKSYQEVFVITSLDKDDLETAIAHALG